VGISSGTPALQSSATDTSSQRRHWVSTAWQLVGVGDTSSANSGIWSCDRTFRIRHRALRLHRRTLSVSAVWMPWGRGHSFGIRALGRHRRTLSHDRPALVAAPTTEHWSAWWHYRRHRDISSRLPGLRIHGLAVRWRRRTLRQPLGGTEWAPGGHFVTRRGTGVAGQATAEHWVGVGGHLVVQPADISSPRRDTGYPQPGIGRVGGHFVSDRGTWSARPGISSATRRHWVSTTGSSSSSRTLRQRLGATWWSRPDTSSPPRGIFVVDRRALRLHRRAARRNHGHLVVAAGHLVLTVGTASR